MSKPKLLFSVWSSLLVLRNFYFRSTTICFVLSHLFSANIGFLQCSISGSSSIHDKLCYLASFPKMVTNTFQLNKCYSTVQKRQNNIHELGRQSICKTMDVSVRAVMERLGVRPLSTVYSGVQLLKWPLLVWTFSVHATVLHSSSFIQHMDGCGWLSSIDSWIEQLEVSWRTGRCGLCLHGTLKFYSTQQLNSYLILSSDKIWCIFLTNN